MQGDKEALQGFLLIFGVNSMKNIMIKSAIVTAVIAATTVTTIADVKVFGRLRMVANCVDTGNSATDECSLENRSSRFGVKANSEISDGLTAFGKYEFGVNADEGAAIGGDRNRLAYVGLKGGFGEVSLGTRWSPLYLHTVSYVDPTNAYGGTWSSGSGYLTDFRNDDTLNYKNKFGAASVGVQIQMDTGTAEDVDEVTIGGSVKVGSATIGFGFQDTTDVQTIAAIHARSKFGPVSVGGTFSTLDSDTAGGDADAMVVALGYAMGGGKVINLVVGNTDNDAAGAGDPTEIGLEYTHNMGAGFKWFAGFSTLDQDIAGSDDVNQFGAGMRYDF